RWTGGWKSNWCVGEGRRRELGELAGEKSKLVRREFKNPQLNSIAAARGSALHAVCRTYGASDFVLGWRSQPLQAGLTCGAPTALEKENDWATALAAINATMSKWTVAERAE